MSDTVHTGTAETVSAHDERVQRTAVVNWAILAACLVLFALIGYWYAPFIPDDSFISFRYAANLASGHGLTFNPGSQPVEAYSNFLWVVLLAAMDTVGLEMTAWAGFVGWLFGGLTIVLLWWILLRRGVDVLPLALTVGLLAISGPLVLYAVSGLETSLFSALLLAAVLAVDYLFERRTVWWATVLGLAGFFLALCRPEGIIALPVLAGCLLLFGRWASQNDRAGGLVLPVIISLGIYAGLLVVYHLWRVAYFDAFWPTPFLSKGAGGGLPVDTWIANLRSLLFRQTHYYAPFGYYYGTLIILALIGAALGWTRRHQLRVEYTALLLALVYLALYLNFTDWMPGNRYLAPLVGLLLIPFSLLATELRPATSDHSPRAALPFTLVAGMMVALSLFGVAVLRNDAAQLQKSTAASLVPLGEWLQRTVPADSVLAMSDVGATPYYSGLTTIDINPASLTDRHIAENGWSSDYFFEVNPDVVVMTAFSLDKPDFYGEHEDLYALPRFQETYERIGVVRNDWYQDRSYWVFLRRSMPISAAQLAELPVGLIKQ